MLHAAHRLCELASCSADNFGSDKYVFAACADFFAASDDFFAAHGLHEASTVEASFAASFATSFAAHAVEASFAAKHTA